ncbi:mechanosensitive ion channel family protein [Streptomyces sp. CMB-StM0423]|uniref:mechanosensitive ion channel family protein n=1 Tax=Streptomyces sp. CMB-StM0423 TaxID=2059884 RepID=UPI000C711FA6|nr:hypothetical protein [Streptomyces sp. CMB-StM0423]AUH40046.1 hypothetical protein CXR04_07145 [Streptomyces sp. CMB-StM0423]
MSHNQTSLAINFTEGFNDAWSKVAQFVPELALFLIILAIGWSCAKVAARVLDRILRKAGSEKLAERAGAARLLTDAQVDITALLCRIAYYGLLLVTLQLGFGVFGPNPVTVMIDRLVTWLPQLIVAVVLVVVAMAIANVVRSLITAALSSVFYGKTVGTAAWAVIATLGVIAALGQAGIATTVTQPVLYAALSAVAGILIVGVGGGLINPMRQRWERWLDVAEQESARARAERDPSGA